MYKISVPTIITNGHFNKEKTLEALKICGADRVALALDRELEYSFSSPENLALLGEMIKFFQKNGLEVIVWLGETLGHSVYPILPSKYTNMRQFGRGDIQSFCPMDELFTNDIGTWIKNIAVLGPDMIMLDDDLRFYFRGGVGCCCRLHMNALAKELGENISEDELYQKIWNGGENKYRSAWLKVQGNSIYDFAGKLRDALNEVSPKTRLSFCSVVSWAGEGWNPITAAKILAGDTKPFLRLAGAPYWVRAEHNTRLGEVIELVRSEIALFKDSGVELFTEGDTYPRPRQECPAAYLECFDMILRADGGADGILKYMLDYVSDADYEKGYIEAMEHNADNCKEITRMFDGKTAIGFRPYNSTEVIKTAELRTDGTLVDRIQNAFRQTSLKFASLNSLPTSYDGNGINILFGENARYIKENELKNGNIIDITSAKILMSRGIDVGISKLLPNNSFEFKGFSALPNEYFIDENTYTRIDLGVNIQNIEHRGGTKLSSEFRMGDKTLPGAYLYENADGIRFLVYPFDMYEARNAHGWFSNYARTRQLLKNAAWLAKKPLDAYINGTHPNMYMIAKKDEGALYIGLWNLFEDRAHNVNIKINGNYQSARFINCSGSYENGQVILNTPIQPYDFAGIELLK